MFCMWKFLLQCSFQNAYATLCSLSPKLEYKVNTLTYLNYLTDESLELDCPGNMLLDNVMPKFCRLTFVTFVVQKLLISQLGIKCSRINGLVCLHY